MGEQITLQDPDFISLVRYPEVGLLDLNIHSIFNFLRNLYTVFYSNSSNLHPTNSVWELLKWPQGSIWSESCLPLGVSPHWLAWCTRLQPHGKMAAILLGVPFLFLLAWPLFSSETPSLTSHYFSFHISIHFSFPVLFTMSSHTSVFVVIAISFPTTQNIHTHVKSASSKKTRTACVVSHFTSSESHSVWDLVGTQ